MPLFGTTIRANLNCLYFDQLYPGKSLEYHGCFLYESCSEGVRPRSKKAFTFIALKRLEASNLPPWESMACLSIFCIVDDIFMAVSFFAAMNTTLAGAAGEALFSSTVSMDLTFEVLRRPPSTSIGTKMLWNWTLTEALSPVRPKTATLLHVLIIS